MLLPIVIYHIFLIFYLNPFIYFTLLLGIKLLLIMIKIIIIDNLILHHVLLLYFEEVGVYVRWVFFFSALNDPIFLLLNFIYFFMFFLLCLKLDLNDKLNFFLILNK